MNILKSVQLRMKDISVSMEITHKQLMSQYQQDILLAEAKADVRFEQELAKLSRHISEEEIAKLRTAYIKAKKED